MKIFNGIKFKIIRIKKAGLIICLIAVIILLAYGLFSIQAEKQTAENNHESAEDISASVASLPETFTSQKKSYSSYKYSKPRSRLKSSLKLTNDESTEAEYVPTPDVLNLAYFYSDEADTDDSINSYAGEIYTELNRMNAEYYSSYFDMIDISPSDMAARLDVSQSKIIGQYDPRNESHIISDSSTWAIDSFKNVNIVFRDGDGNKTDGRYLAKEIMSLANVYSYYHDMNDVSGISEYCKELFKKAFSANVSIGNIYYCSGCLNRSLHEEALEAAAMESLGLYKNDDNSIVEIINTSYKDKEKEESIEMTYGENLYDDIIILKSGSNEPISKEEYEKLKGPGHEEDETDDFEPVEEYFSESNDQDISGTLFDESTSITYDQIVEELPDDFAENEDLSDEEKVLAALLESVPGANSVSSYCPGHVDLEITISIKGINDKNGLFKADKKGNNKENFNADWQGWTEDKVELAKNLCNKDWFEEYGLSVSSIDVSEQLTEEEINAFMKKLPAETSDLRKEIISCALNSVGKIPYYWGGKPVNSGFEDNDFYRIVQADNMGRILKGLDCSGWVNWVYWTVTGAPLDGEGTGTLAGCGTKIKRSDLQPGDIIIKTGTDSHVVMFLCWQENGQMTVIHESGGIINNVNVETMPANWSYYRSLIE